jgi:hypothetical protein
MCVQRVKRTLEKLGRAAIQLLLQPSPQLLGGEINTKTNIDAGYCLAHRRSPSVKKVLAPHACIKAMLPFNGENEKKLLIRWSSVEG